MAISRAGQFGGNITARANVASHGLLHGFDERRAVDGIAIVLKAIETFRFGGARAGPNRHWWVGVRRQCLGCAVWHSLVELYGHGRSHGGGVYVVWFRIAGLG